jgi:hypothetical protein
VLLNSSDTICIIDLPFSSVNLIYWKDPPYNLMVPSWSIPESNGGKQILDFPPLSEVVTDEPAREKLNLQIQQWNKRLAALEEFKGQEPLKIIAGGYMESRLSPKGSLGLW